MMRARDTLLASIILAVASVALCPSSEAATPGRRSRNLRDSFDNADAVARTYDLNGRVRHDARRRCMVFGGSGWFVSKRQFSNHVDVMGRVFVPSTIATVRDEVGLLLRQGNDAIPYGASIVYGREHPAFNSLTIVRGGTVVARAPLELQRGAWYRIRVRTDGLRLMAKAWPVGTAEPPAYQLSVPVAADWRAGGIGFGHVGTGTLVDDLAVNELGQISADAALRAALPRPILDDRPDFVALYWKAWEIARTRLRAGTDANGFAPAYLDEGFNENIFQWDTCFMALFAIYAQGALPSVESLDNFYRKQHADGFICREIRERDGTDYHTENSDEAINPPLFAWVEWRYWRHTGDASRLAAVLPILARYYDWIAANRAGTRGLPLQSNLGSGMDNSPRHGGGWVDLAAQQAHAALTISWIAGQLGDLQRQRHYGSEYVRLRDTLERYCWDDADGIYYDLDENGERVKIKTVAAFWPLLAQVPAPEHVDRLLSHLRSRDEFLRAHRVPTLSADHPDYDPAGGYWKGAVWAPTDFMIVKGLEACDLPDEARLIALNHLTTMAQVFKDTGTIWENYAPDSAAPGTPAKRDFVGWSGCGPIALLIENVLGFQTDGAADTLYWRIREPGRHGIENLVFGDNVVSLVCERPVVPNGPRTVTVLTTSPFVLTIDTPASQTVHKIADPKTTFQVKMVEPRLH
jgi:hypothetical protein